MGFISVFALPGDTEWLPGQELPLAPWDLVRKPLSQRITIRIKGRTRGAKAQVEPPEPVKQMDGRVRKKSFDT